MASRWSWPETVKNTGLSKYSPSFCAIDWLLSLLIDCDDLATFIDWFVLLIDCWGSVSRAFIVVILNTSPPPSQSFDVNIGVWIWI